MPLKLLRFLVIIPLLLHGSLAGASVLTEAFEEPFGDWETRWLGTSSNLANYYVISGGAPITDRGNNPDGLWLDDGDGAYFGDVSEILFESTFGSSLTYFRLDVAGYQPVRLEVFDSNSIVLLSVEVALTFGAMSDPGTYSTYSVSSNTGIGGFRFLESGGSQVEGNTSIDNVEVHTGAVPEPAATGLLIGAVWLLALAGRRQV